MELGSTPGLKSGVIPFPFPFSVKRSYGCPGFLAVGREEELTNTRLLVALGLSVVSEELVVVAIEEGGGGWERGRVVNEVGGGECDVMEDVDGAEVTA